MDLFFSTEGRITRKPFWIGTLVVLMSGVAMSAVMMTIAITSGGNVSWAGVLIGLVLLYPMIALVTKRLRDRGRANLPLWVALYLVPGQLVNLMQLLDIGFDTIVIDGIAIAQPTLLGMIASLGALVVFIVALVDLGCLAGRAPAYAAPG